MELILRTSFKLNALSESVLYYFHSKFKESPDVFDKLRETYFRLEYFKEDRQSTYNVTLRRVHVTIVAVEKQ
jgi:hypothetical protein